MDPDLTDPTPTVHIADVSLDEDRAAAERALQSAQSNPVLSGEQACAVAQVHALLAIERRLAQLCTVLRTAHVPSDQSATGAALAALS
jgi:hypothetical protein